MRLRATAGLLVGMALLAGCKTLDRMDPGLILVGSPQVVTRERLVNDRLEQEKWLKAQLAAAENENFERFQGASDVRTFVGTAVGVGINANPLEQQAYRQESEQYLASLERQRSAAERAEEIARLDHEIMLERKRQELDKVRGDSLQALATPTETGTTSAAAATTTPGTAGAASGRPQPPGGTPAPDVGGFVDRLIKDGREKLLPSAGALGTADKVFSSPVDIFRDKLAYREEIRAELLENGLDDRHDVSGSTLYRLSFDATVWPKSGMDDWAVVEVELTRGEDKTLFEDWRDGYQEDLKLRLNYHLRQFVECGEEGGTCRLPDALAMKLLLHADCPQSDTQAAKALQRLSQQALPRSVLVKSIRELAKQCSTQEEQRKALLTALWDEEVGTQDLGQIVRLKRGVDYVQLLPLVDGEKKSFYDRLHAAESSQFYAYAVTPKESVQRISELEGHRRALELAASIGLLTGEASINTAISYIKESQTLLQGIRRQPLVVGFIGPRVEAEKKREEQLKKDVLDKICEAQIEQADAACEAERAACEQESKNCKLEYCRDGSEKCKLEGEDCDKAREKCHNAGSLCQSAARVACHSSALNATCTSIKRMALSACDGLAVDLPKVEVGWLIGPKFEAKKRFSDDPVFSHTAIQNGLNAVISVPAWWRKIQVKVQPSWRGGKDLAVRQPLGSPPPATISLPGDIFAITNLLIGAPKPRVSENVPFTLVKGQPAQLLIQGENLWRGSVVTVGSQSTSDIEVLAAMDGIIAKFGPITEPLGKDIPVRVWTSAGMVVVGNATIIKEAPAVKEFAIKLVTTRLVAGSEEKIELKVVGGEVPAGFSEAKIGIRPAGRRDQPWIFSKATVDGSKITADLPKGPDGKALSYSSGQKLDVYLSIQLRDEPAQNDIHVTAKEKPIFYKDAAAAKVIVGATGSVKPKDPIRFTFPTNALDAFPGFDVNLKVILRSDTVREILPGAWQSATEPWYFDATLPDLKPGTYELILEPELPGLKFSQTTIEVKK